MTTDGSSSGGGRFPTTRGSALLALRDGDAELRRLSLDAVALAYWKPVYKYTRIRWRRPRSDAADITQGFFADALEHGTFAAYDPRRARFRTYVRGCLDLFVLKQDRATGAQKRGGGALVKSLDVDAVEAELAQVDASARSPEELFDAEWVRSLLGIAVDDLRERCMRQGKDQQFVLFARYDLEGDAAARPTYAALAAELQISTSDVTNWLHAVRRDFRRIVLERLREITADEEEFRNEAIAVLGVEP